MEGFPFNAWEWGGIMWFLHQVQSKELKVQCKHTHIRRLLCNCYKSTTEIFMVLQLGLALLTARRFDQVDDHMRCECNTGKLIHLRDDFCVNIQKSANTEFSLNTWNRQTVSYLTWKDIKTTTNKPSKKTQLDSLCRLSGDTGPWTSTRSAQQLHSYSRICDTRF